MPTYEYLCAECEHRFELFQSITAKPVRKCPECGRKAVDRLLGTGAGLIFKGSGFYITDYRSESYKAGAKGDSSPASSPAANGSTPSGAADRSGASSGSQSSGDAGASQPSASSSPCTSGSATSSSGKASGKPGSAGKSGPSGKTAHMGTT